MFVVGGALVSPNDLILLGDDEDVVVMSSLSIKILSKSGSFRGIPRTEERNSSYDSLDETSIGATTKRMINLSGYICVKKDKYNPNYKSLVAIEPLRSIREVQETSKFKEINLDVLQKIFPTI